MDTCTPVLVDPEPPLTTRIIAMADAVYEALGPFQREECYRNALCVELKRAGFDVEKEKTTVIEYKGFQVGTCRSDIYARHPGGREDVVLEVKWVARPTTHWSMLQVMRYAEQLSGETRWIGTVEFIKREGEQPRVMMVQVTDEEEE